MYSLVRSLRVSVTRSARAFSAAPISRSADAPADALQGEQLITQKLTEMFSPSQLQVQDVSGMLLLGRANNILLTYVRSVQVDVAHSMPSLSPARLSRTCPSLNSISWSRKR